MGLFIASNDLKDLTDQQRADEKHEEEMHAARHAHDAALKKEGLRIPERIRPSLRAKRPVPRITMKEAFQTFSAANMDSDWDDTEEKRHMTIDTELVTMEFLEGIARLAYRAEMKKRQLSPRKASSAAIDAETFAVALRKFFAYIVSEFRHWHKYIAHLLPETNQAEDGDDMMNTVMATSASHRFMRTASTKGSSSPQRSP